MRTENQEFAIWPIPPFGGDIESDDSNDGNSQDSNDDGNNSDGNSAGNRQDDSDKNDKDDSDSDDDDEDEDDEFEGMSASELKRRLKETKASKKATDKEKADLQAKIDKADRKEKSALQLAETDRDKYKSESEAKDKIIEKQAIMQGILSSTKYVPHDANDLVFFIDRSEITIDDDGKAEGLESQLKKLAKDKPHLFKSTSKDDNNDDGSNSGRRGPTGSQPGQGAKIKTDANAKDKAKLVNLYPALAGR